jgi:predicted small lipoprotein YifL
MKTRTTIAMVLALAFPLAACGQSKPAQSPDDVAAETTSTSPDMPPPAKEATAAPEAAAAPAEAAPAPAVAGGVIKIAALKVTPAKKGKDKTVDVKDDGTVSIGGKAAAMIKGDSVDTVRGTSMVTVGIDGSLVGNGVAPGFKFDGDDLVTDGGARLTVGSDGAITASRKGKTATLAKTDGPPDAKRAALVVTVLYMTVPAWVTSDGAPKAGKAKK